MTTRDEILARQEALKVRFGQLYGDVLAILIDVDPARVNHITNKDEYSPEVDTILPRLPECICVEDVIVVVREEMTRWFDPDDRGTAAEQANIGRLIWEAMACYPPQEN